MTRFRTPVCFFLSFAFAVLAGCSSTGGSGGGRGGYYKDDGPGSNIPANIEAIPDAQPRVERHAPANFRPYVVFGKRYVPVSDGRPFRQQGTASWYGRKFHGQKTANGETYDMYGMTAAHPTLPLPSYARVTHAGSGRTVIVRINDRGPFHSARIIDLSYVAAAKLGLIGPGSGQVIVEAITNDDIRSGRFTRPATKTPAPAAPAPAPLEPAPVPDAPILIARQSGPATPNALDALKHDAAGGTDDVGAMTASLQSPDAPPTTRDAAPGAEVFLQFGAFSAAQTAVSLAGKLNQQIGPFEPRQAYVQEGDGLHRVRIGPYPSRTAAVNASVRIQQETGLQSSMALR